VAGRIGKSKKIYIHLAGSRTRHIYSSIKRPQPPCYRVRRHTQLSQKKERYFPYNSNLYTVAGLSDLVMYSLSAFGYYTERDPSCCAPFLLEEAVLAVRVLVFLKAYLNSLT
jgi:hypothetical protein